MSGYNKATSDPRGLFNRFLPPTWRNTDSSNIVHNAIIKSIANTLVSAESDLLDSRAESYLERASGVFLDKWVAFQVLLEEQMKQTTTIEHESSDGLLKRRVL